ncbi:MAG: 3-phosphoshikimate 1-carboxyvinyltransferase [Dehalococcoidia bacterium]
MAQALRKPRRLKGEITPPSDKSISHRSLILNSMAAGEASISNFLPAADCLSTLSCLQAIGVNIELRGSEVRLRGAGGAGFTRPDSVLNAGNSGTTTRLLSGLLATQPFTSTITGDDSLRLRPMVRIIEPLRLMGARIEGKDGKAPLTITGGNLHGIRYKTPVPSAQVKSAILIASLAAEGATVVEEPAISRDHTERMLLAMGADIRPEYLTVTLNPAVSALNTLNISIPGDISSAAFWLVAGVIHPEARITIRGTGMNPTRNGIIEVLQSMGASIIIENQRLEGYEPIADLMVESSALKGVEIRGDLIPRLIDEIPVIAVAASVARGTTVIRDAAELRVKESDRIKATVTELTRMGAQIEETPDGMVIQGVSKLRGAQCQTYVDHRLAMAIAVAGICAEGETFLSEYESVDISYPDFWRDLERIIN